MLDETFLIQDASPPVCQSDGVRLTTVCDRSWVSGPGPRAVLWVAGCLRRCPGCINKAFHNFSAGSMFSVESLADRILAIPGLRGVTYSGGEPFEQAEPLARLSQTLRRAGLSIASYSGYTLNALRQAPDRYACLLNELDVLIDGEYRHEVAAKTPWVGSGNQQIHLFTQLAVSEGWTESQNASLHLEVSLGEGHINLVGLSTETDRLLRERLRSRGILLSLSAKQ